MPNYRNRRLLDLAHRVHTCQACGKWVGTEGLEDGCEPAHANWGVFGKGGALKAHDCFHAALCHSCHAELDQGDTMSKDEKKAFWWRAHIATMLLYFTNDWLRVA
jgi:hypothetical protein